MDLFNKFPLLTRTFVFILVPAFILAMYGYDALFNKALPSYSGEFQVANIDQEVTVERDTHGTTYITAGSDQDVYFAMGFVHAQDRLWQLELQRRFARGTLAEVFGKEAVPSDVWMRTLGLYSSAESAYPALSNAAKQSLESYARGVNAWLKKRPALPVEFTLLGLEPSDWTPLDSLAWAKVFALDLAGNMGSELQRFLVKQHLEEDKFVSLFSHDSELANIEKIKSTPQWLAALGDVVTLQTDLEEHHQLGGRYVGSNAWVVSGQHTVSGTPILANDPHLGLQVPSLWYAVNQKTPHQEVSGMSLVGLPIVVFGKNQNIGWGGTNMMADVQDLFIEQINPDNPNQYRHAGEWREFTTTTEQIFVKADFPASMRKPFEPLEIEIRRTINGPIISDYNKSAGMPVSLMWTALQEGDTTYEALFQVNQAQDWAEFNQALSKFVAPALNMLFADTQGNIGFVGAGKIPLRKHGQGQLPQLAAQSPKPWEGFIPFSEMPREFNPQSGILVSANNRNTPEHYPFFISNDWAPDARAERIRELLESQIERDKIGLPTMAKIQSDTKDLSVEALVHTFSNVKASESEQAMKAAVERVQAWDRHASTDSVGASITYGWIRHIRKRIFEDELTTHWNQREQGRYLNALTRAISPDKINELLQTESQWCDDITTDVAEDCTLQTISALEDTLRELTKYAGSDMDDWRWGKLQHTVYAHKPFSDVKVLDNLFERRINSAGAENTINVAAATFDKSEGYQQRFGAGFRQIFSMGNDASSHWFMNSTGQSGHVASPHYDDMVEPFRNVEFVEMTPLTEHLQTLVLVPSKQEQ